MRGGGRGRTRRRKEKLSSVKSLGGGDRDSVEFVRRVERFVGGKEINFLTFSSVNFLIVIRV